jgi:two-component system chemotaxis response regulator CheB
MSHRPIPVVMISSLTEQGAEETIKALELGAIDYITKPTREIEKNFEKLSSTICHKIKVAASAKVSVRSFSSQSKPLQFDEAKIQQIKVHNRFIAIGASTGGVEAISTVINSLPEKTPPILIVQHMPEKFTTSFAARLNRSSKLTVYEAEDGQILEPSSVYLAPGKYHLGVKKMGESYSTYLNDGLDINGHKPSVDFLFNSMANMMIGNQICAFLLTGMGKDGAHGLQKLKEKGAKTYAQDKASCVVYGMPRVAFEISAIEKELNI